MKSIMMTYPGFQALPKGIKQLLLASESFFFDEPKKTPTERRKKPTQAVTRGLSLFGLATNVAQSRFCWN